MANGGSVKQHSRPWEVNQSENKRTGKFKEEQRQPAGWNGQYADEKDTRSKKIKRYSRILLAVEELRNICYQESSTAQTEAEKVESWSLQKRRLIHDILMMNEIIPNMKSARSPFDPVEDDECPHSIQPTILSSYASERQPEVSSDFYEPPPKPPQFSSSYGPTGCAALVSLDQPFPSPTNNAAGRGSIPSDNTYRFDPTPPHNHVEMQSSYGSRAYPSKPCGYVNMSSSPSSCARAQPALTSGNWVSRLSPTALQAYKDSSYYDTEEQLLCSRPQKSQDPLPHYNWAQSQPALNTAQFDQRPEPRPATPWSILDSYSELPPVDNLTNRVQLDHPQPPRHAVSSRSIQPYLNQPSIYDQVPRKPALDSAQFEPVRRVPATRNNPNRVEAFSRSRSYLDQTAGDTAYLLQPSRRAAAAPTNYNVNLMSSSYNDTYGNHSTVELSTFAPPGCVEEVTITRKLYYPDSGYTL